jgi:hypothetical protein
VVLSTWYPSFDSAESSYGLFNHRAFGSKLRCGPLNATLFK